MGKQLGPILMNIILLNDFTQLIHYEEDCHLYQVIG